MLPAAAQQSYTTRARAIASRRPEQHRRALDGKITALPGITSAAASPQWPLALAAAHDAEVELEEQAAGPNVQAARTASGNSEENLSQLHDRHSVDSDDGLGHAVVCPSSGAASPRDVDDSLSSEAADSEEEAEVRRRPVAIASGGIERRTNAEAAVAASGRLDMT